MPDVKNDLSMLRWALRYRSHGISVIPINPENKKPLIGSWKGYQSTLPTEAEIKAWWTKWPNAMIGCITGRLSGLFVIDIDGPDGKEHLAVYLPDSLNTPRVMTPRGGEHIYFRMPETNLTSRNGVFPQVDYKGEGGYVILPSSVNAEGGRYQWTTRS